MSSTRVKSWAQLRALGVAIRIHFAESTEAAAAIRDQYNGGAMRLVTEALESLGKSLHDGGLTKVALIPDVEEEASKLGPAGRLALCDLCAANIATTADVLMLYVHSVVRGTTTHGVRVKVTGCYENDTAWDHESAWPHIIPQTWNQNGNFAFRYEFTEGGKSLVVHSKGMVMGEMLLLTVLPTGSESPLTVSIKVPDFAQGTSNAILTAVDDLSPRGNGLSSIITRAAATQLNELIQTQIVTPVLDLMGVSRPSGTEAATRQPGRRNDQRRDDPLRIGVPRQPRVPPVGGGFPRPGFGGGAGIPRFPGGFDGDLNPGGMGGGSLFGPGNPGFDQHFGRGTARGPPNPTVPPGARYDPVGPGQPRGPPGPQRGTGPYPGGPRPDHLRPPDYDDDMYY